MDLPLDVKMPDSPDISMKNQEPSNGISGLNGSTSPHPPGNTPSPPMSSLSSPHSAPYPLEMPSGKSISKAKYTTKVKRFLTILQQFSSDISVEIGDRVHTLILALLSSSVSVEDFNQKIQEITNYPLKPFAVPFLKSHLPLLQAELIHFSRMAKQTPQQYLRQHEHFILDSASHPGTEPFEIFQPENGVKENGKRWSPNRNTDYSETNGDQATPAKRHHPLPSSSLGPRTSPAASGLGLPPNLTLRLDDPMSIYRDREGRLDRYERYERELYRPFHATVSRDYSEEREMEEEWRNIHTMLNCILGMVEKTKKALCILQHRSYLERSDLPRWGHLAEKEHKKSHPADIVSHFKVVEGRVSEVRRRAEEAVNEVKRQAVVELQRAVSEAESKANELLAAERIKMERLLAEARRQAAEDALAVATHQEESTENCWNCGRKANETCSGCNVARYCGSFCQHKDWETHHRLCGQTSNHSALLSSSSPPKTTPDNSSSPARTSSLGDIKPVKMDCV